MKEGGNVILLAGKEEKAARLELSNVERGS